VKGARWLLHRVRKKKGREVYTQGKKNRCFVQGESEERERWSGINLIKRVGPGAGNTERKKKRKRTRFASGGPASRKRKERATHRNQGLRVTIEKEGEGKESQKEKKETHSYWKAPCSGESSLSTRMKKGIREGKKVRERSSTKQKEG